MIAERARRLLGPDAIVGDDARGRPIAAPNDLTGVALLLETATAEGWHIAVTGRGQWAAGDVPADLVLSTRRLDRTIAAAPEDLVVTADAGVPWSALQSRLVERGVWVGLDHPGADRSLGSLAATATVGALAAGTGRVRDHVLGLTFVTGAGRIVRAGGTVVKNVAGYDLTKLAIGSFGAFGVIVSVTFRLRAVPRSDVTLRAAGPRDALLEAALAASDSGLSPQALELYAPDAADPDGWCLAARFAGRSAEVQAATDTLRRSAPLSWSGVEAMEAADFWHERQRLATALPTTIRLGAVPTALSKCCDTLARLGTPCPVSISVPAGLIRATGGFSADTIHRLRQRMTELEVPVTVERAPWDVLSRVGHFGAYREGAGVLTARLRETFDPAGVLTVALGDIP